MQDITKNIDSEPDLGIANNASIEEATSKAAIPSVNLVSFFGMLMMITSLVAGGMTGVIAAIISFVCACHVLCRLGKFFFKTNVNVDAQIPASRDSESITD